MTVLPLPLSRLITTERRLVPLPASSPRSPRLFLAVARTMASAGVRSTAARVAGMVALTTVVSAAGFGPVRAPAFWTLLDLLVRIAVVFTVLFACAVAEEVAHIAVVWAKRKPETIRGMRVSYLGAGPFKRLVLTSTAVLLRGDLSYLDELHVRLGGTLAFAATGAVSFAVLWASGVLDADRHRALLVVAALLLCVLPLVSLLPARFSPTGDARAIRQLSRVLNLDRRALARECRESARQVVWVLAGFGVSTIGGER